MLQGLSGIISIHVPSWGTTDVVGVEDLVNLFQSTFPRGERRLPIFAEAIEELISIHVPSWGTTCRHNQIVIIANNFNPRSLVGNDPTP